jgi:hypothetical protein
MRSMNNINILNEIGIWLLMKLLALLYYQIFNLYGDFHLPEVAYIVKHI